MFTDLYIEALLTDEDLADQVWELWDAAIISDDLAALDRESRYQLDSCNHS